MQTLFATIALVLTLSAAAQSEVIKPAAKGVVYGQAPAADGTPVAVNKLQEKLAAGAFEGKITGTVKEVCKSMGCWITLEKEDGTALLVKSKDHGYFMPQNLVGKTVLIEGTATATDVSEETRKHLAEDAGKSKDEIAAIKGSEKEIQFVAKGVKVLD